LPYSCTFKVQNSYFVQEIIPGGFIFPVNSALLVSVLNFLFNRFEFAFQKATGNFGIAIVDGETIYKNEKFTISGTIKFVEVVAFEIRF
jgi:hypothetical protein